MDSKGIDQRNLTVNQHHTGPGNNSVTIFTSINADNLEASVTSLMGSMARGNLAGSELELNALCRLHNQHKDASLALNLVGTKLKLRKHEAVANPVAECRRALAEDNRLIADIAYATLVEFHCGSRCDQPFIEHREIEAQFGGLWTSQFPFYAESFFRLLGGRDEMAAALATPGAELEPVLCGIFAGCVRLDDYPLAVKAAEKLAKSYPSASSSEKLLIAQGKELLSQTRDSHIWSVSLDQREAFKAIIVRILTLINQSCGRYDLGDVPAAIFLFTCVEFDWTSIESELASDAQSRTGISAAQIVRQILDLSQSETADFNELYDLTKDDPNYALRIADECLAERTITATKHRVMLATEFTDPDFDHKRASLSVICDDEYESDLILIESLERGGFLRTHEERKELLLTFGRFVDKYPASIHRQLLPRCVWLSERLLGVHKLFAPTVVKLLEPHLPVGGKWGSQVSFVYLRALLVSDQLLTFSQLYEKIYNASFITELQLLRHYFCVITRDCDGALAASTKLVSIDSTDIIHWGFHIQSFRMGAGDKGSFARLLSDIPEAAFESNSPFVHLILKEMIENNNEHRAHQILLRRFARNPIKEAKLFLQVVASSFNVDTPPEPEITNGPCLFGVRYARKGGEHLAMVVSPRAPEYPDFVPIRTSELGELLSNTSVGKSFRCGHWQGTVLERVPPLIAALSIAEDICSKRPDNNGGLELFEIPDDPEEATEALTQLLLDTQRAVTPPFVPAPGKSSYNYLQVRFGSDTVKGALWAILSGEFPGFRMIDAGANSSANIVLDVYSALYLAFTGLFFQKEDLRYFVTQETRVLLESWIADMTSDDYMAMALGLDNELVLTTSETLPDWSIEIESLRQILSVCEEAIPCVADAPPGLLTAGQHFGPSIVSTIRAATLNGLDWLCIDPGLFAHGREVGYNVVNTKEYFSLAVDQTPFDRKRVCLLRVSTSNFFYPWRFSDVIELSGSSEQSDIRYITLLLKKMAGHQLDYASAVRFSADVFVNTLVRHMTRYSFSEGEARIRDLQLAVDVHQLFNSAFRVVLDSNYPNKPEKTVALLLGCICRLCVDEKLWGVFQLLNDYIDLFITGNFLDRALVQDFLQRDAANRSPV